MRESVDGTDGKKVTRVVGRRLKKSNCSVEEAGSRKGLSPPLGPSAALLCITEQVYPGEESVPFVPSLGHTPRHLSC